MTLKALAQNLIHQATSSQNQITLDEGSTGRSDIAQLIKKHLLREEGNILAIVDHTTIPSDPPATGFTLHGYLPGSKENGFLDLSDNNIIIQFTENNSEIVIVFSVYLDKIKDQAADWNFRDSFASIKSPDLDNLVLSSQKFIFHSGTLNGPNESKGLFFQADISLTGPIGLITDLMSRTDPPSKADPTYSLSGQISQTTSGPSFQLQADLRIPPIDLAIVDLKNAHSGVALSYYTNGAIENQFIKFFLGAIVDLKNKDGTSISLDVDVMLPNEDFTTKEFSLSIQPASQFTTSIDNLGKLVGGESWDIFFGQSTTAAKLKSLLANFGLQAFSAGFTFSPFSINWWNLRIGTLSPWVIIDEKVVLNSFSLDWYTIKAGTNSQQSITLTGELQFFDDPTYLFDAEVTLPELSVTASFTGNLTFNVGNLLDKVATTFSPASPVPSNIKSVLGDFTLSSIFVKAQIPQHSYSFGCLGNIHIVDKEVDFIVYADITSDLGTYNYDIKGSLIVGLTRFTGEFIKDSTNTIFRATWTSDRNLVGLQSILESIGFDSNDIPGELDLGLKSITFNYDFQNKSVFLLAQTGNENSAFIAALKDSQQQRVYMGGLKLTASFDLANLPLIGKVFPKNESVGIKDMQFLLLNKELTKSEIETWKTNNLLPSTGFSLPDRDLGQGLSIDGQLNLGRLSKSLDLPVSENNPTSNNSTADATQTSTPFTSADKATWFSIQKKLGPVDFERVGMQYEKGELWFLLDASLSAGGLKITLQGLAAGSSLQVFEPKFRLNGLGIDFKKGPLEIGGAFLKVPDVGKNVQYEYDGTAIIKTEELMLAAIGSYAALTDGHKSLFIYAVLDYPLGGPAFFFVTGLAAGFGYNRRLITPAIDQVASFPLVSEAMNGATPIPSGTGSRDALSAELAKIRTYIPPEEDQYFLAVGIKFNSFKMIDSFALLTISFGHHFELDLLGLSTLLLPTPEAGSSVEPLAEVQMALKASFIPDEGFLGIEAQLTTASFLLSRKCHLTGGFAFYSWFAGPHEGDFVITVGGYHPSFHKPSHYPSVPQLGFNWQVTDKLSLKGGAYFALTASAVMAGGRLEALWDDGNLKAWFIAGADFLIAWKPYYYDARIYVDMGVSYTFHFFGTHTISVDIGADLHIWGPDFSGTAHVKLWIVSFTVSFGAGASQAPQPIDWPNFRTSFLPAADKDIVSITARKGLKKQVDNGDADWIVDPKHLEFEVNSIIPVKKITLGTDAQKSSGQEAFGIAPMGLNQNKVESTIKITITDKDPNTTAPQDLNDFTDKFTPVPIKKNVPKGMWGETVSPNLNGQKFIQDATTGYQIQLNAQDEEPTSKPAPIDRHKFEFSTKDMSGYINQKAASTFIPNYPGNWRDQLKQDLKSNGTRDDILAALSLTSESDTALVDSYVDELILSPQFKGQAV